MDDDDTTRAMMCVVPYVDIPTAARLRAVCREFRDIVDATRRSDEFAAHGLHNCMFLHYVAAPGDHRRIHRVFPDISKVRRDDLIQIFRDHSGMTGPCVVWRGLFPIHRIARLVKEDDVLRRGHYCIETVTQPWA